MGKSFRPKRKPKGKRGKKSQNVFWNTILDIRKMSKTGHFSSQPPQTMRQAARRKGEPRTRRRNFESRYYLIFLILTRLEREDADYPSQGDTEKEDPKI